MSYRDRLSTNLGKYLDDHLGIEIDIHKRSPILYHGWRDLVIEYVNTGNIKMLKWALSVPGGALVWSEILSINRKSKEFTRWYVYYYTYALTCEEFNGFKYALEFTCPRCRIKGDWKIRTYDMNYIECTVCDVKIVVHKWYELWRIYARLHRLVPTVDEALKSLVGSSDLKI